MAVWRLQFWRVTSMGYQDRTGGSRHHRNRGSRYRGNRDGCYSPDNRWLVIVGRGGPQGETGTILMWDRETGQQRHRLQGHNRLVRRAVFSADSKRMASVGDDGALILWDVETGQAIITIAAHAGPIPGRRS